MKKYAPEYCEGMKLSGLALQGDGLFLAEDAGAAIEGYATILKEGPRLDLRSWPLMHFERDPYALWVNKDGERFVDEAVGYHVFESVNAMLRQPEKVSYALFDAVIRKLYEDKMPDIERALQAEVTKGRVKTGRFENDMSP